ncbi:MAG: hemolysin III family protein [Thermoanaerobaculales bacterium]|jgi:hemolysin III|nr:hemolysin III family protein [Thermoanaerobaculales bacterium]
MNVGGEHREVREAAHRIGYTPGEELANSLTHGVGALLAVGGLAWLVTLAALRGDAWHVVACSIYGAAMVVLYTASTLYHAIPTPRVKRALQTFDHAAIFLLIAGTYTPFTLVSLRGPWGWSIFGTVWGLAAAGIVLEIVFPRRWPALSLTLYVAMGWVVVVAVRPLLAALPPGGLALLLLGGLAYTGGIGFYAWKRLPYGHAVWHLFVLAGTVLHFLAILLYVVPS